jgi:hypothetical protein
LNWVREINTREMRALAVKGIISRRVRVIVGIVARHFNPRAFVPSLADGSIISAVQLTRCMIMASRFGIVLMRARVPAPQEQDKQHRSGNQKRFQQWTLWAQFITQQIEGSSLNSGLTMLSALRIRQADSWIWGLDSGSSRFWGADRIPSRYASRTRTEELGIMTAT